MTGTDVAHAPPGTGAVRWAHRAHLDGARALAVLLVILFHAEAPGFEGGFVGVDVFFVLSGFVVTGSLLSEHARTGTIALRSFYARRVRRLLPAASVLLLALVVGLRLVASPFERVAAAGDLAAASLYSANWWFVAQAADYFAADGAESPVLHFWSLAVEEQFYLVWPLLLLALLPRVLDAGRRRAATVVALLAAVSLAAALATPDASLLTAYYGTHTRVYQLFAGALLALAAVRGGFRRLPAGLALPGAVVGVVGLVVASTDVVPLDAVDRGVLAALLSVVLIGATEVGADHPVGDLLRSRPAHRLGALSYAVYLWHWPITLVVLRRELVGPALAWVVVLAGAWAAALLSERFVEGPARRLDVERLGPWRVVAAGLTVSALVAGAAVLVLAGDGDTVVDWQAAAEDLSENLDCVDAPAAECRVVDGEEPGILLYGDSHAAHWAPAVAGLARQTGVAMDMATIGACPWAEVELDRGSIRGDCDALRADAVDRLAPGAQLVLLSSRAMYERTPVGLEEGEDAFDVVLAGVRPVLDDLLATGATVVVLGPAPEPPTNVPSCLSEAATPDACDFAREPSFPERAAALRAEVEAAGAVWLPTDEVACPSTTCDAVVGDVVGWADVNHLSGRYAATLDDRLREALAPHWTP